MMTNEGLACSIESVLLNREKLNEADSSLLKRVMNVCAAFRSDVITSFEKHLTVGTELSKRNKTIGETIAQISSNVEDVESQLNDVMLRQKVIEKQIQNVVRRREKLVEELEDARSLKESLCLEMVDLEQEIDERKKEKKLKWDAIKRACRVYKTTLGIHIKIVETWEDRDNVRIRLFVKENTVNDADYYADLVRKAETWNVECIQPVLEPEHEDQLKCVVNFSNKRQVIDIRAFLCQLRNIFLKYYCNR